MRNFGFAFACFVIGFSISIVKQCSEATVKTIRRYFSAILIISVVWGFIGYSFARRYLHAESFTAGIVSAVMVLLVIHIERQIILSPRRNKSVFVFRSIVGVVMALIGSLIMDQILFADDIEKIKVRLMPEVVNAILPARTRQIEEQLRELDTLIAIREKERIVLSGEISRSPQIALPTVHTEYEKDSTGRLVAASRSVISQAIPNPKITQFEQLNKQLEALHSQKAEKEESLMNIRKEIEQELQNKNGLLDEINALFTLLKLSFAGFVVWGLFFLFFFSLELFVLINKWGDIYNDYDFLVNKQMHIRIKHINSLFGSNPGENISGDKSY